MFSLLLPRSHCSICYITFGPVEPWLVWPEKTPPSTPVDVKVLPTPRDAASSNWVLAPILRFERSEIENHESQTPNSKTNSKIVSQFPCVAERTRTTNWTTGWWILSKRFYRSFWRPIVKIESRNSLSTHIQSHSITIIIHYIYL